MRDPGADRAWMAQALALAALGEGTTRPNPRVGCVVVRDGTAVGRGWHARAGEPHAEAAALAEAGPRARGATLYVNLEPCAHHGRTPPCADAVAAAGVGRVVAAITDPDPRVHGRGFARLREAGIAVEVGPMAAEARALNAAFLAFHEAGRPRVTLKAGISADGMLAGAGGASRWITGPEARRFAHRLRLRHDAILVGAGTVRRDDPALDVRLPGAPWSPRVAVLAPSGELPAGARALAPSAAPRPPARVYVQAGRAGAGHALRGGAEIVPVPAAADGGLDLRSVLADLAAAGAQSVLVEGGGRTIAAFLAAGLADAVALFQAPLLLGARGGVPLVDGAAAGDPARGIRLAGVRRIPLGEDLLVLAEVACSPV